MQAWQRPSIAALTPLPGAVTVYDTASGGLLELAPTDGTARVYVCGITPYDATHLGHAATYVGFDLLNRQLLDTGLRLNYTQNITDVDDPLLERANATGVDWADLANDQIALFRTDMEALAVIPPDHYVGVVEAIDLVVALIQRLQDAGLVYALDDPEHPDLYFRCSQAPGFLDESHLDVKAARAIFGERGGDPDRPGKEDPLDCLVWRRARDGEPSWPSPLGAGRPGWHVECTAIALHHLGPDFDVQGGGSDLVFPHHDMCATQARAATGEPLARTFVHAGMVGYDGEKMSKSLGNLVLVSKLRAAGVDPMAIRLVLLAHHYRSDWEYTQADLDAALARLAQWRSAVGQDHGADAATLLDDLRAALRNDLDAPAALARVDAWAEATLAGGGDDPEATASVLGAVDALLGVRL